MNRIPETGRFTFDGNLSRMCKCGHTLGEHDQLGLTCFHGMVQGNEQCECEKFKEQRKKK